MAESKSPPNRKLFHKAHYGIIAAQFSEALKPHVVDLKGWQLTSSGHSIARVTLVTLALEMAVRFKHDNEAFNAVRFLNHCSPDLTLLPLGELWDDTEHSVKVPTNATESVANLDNIAAIREQSLSDQRLK